MADRVGFEPTLHKAGFEEVFNMLQISDFHV